MPQEETQDDYKQTYYCTRCNEKLSFLDGTIIKLNGEITSNDCQIHTQLFLPARLGHYGAIVAGNVELVEGAKVEYYCINPKCHHNFSSTVNDALAEIHMVDGSGNNYVVLFNKIYGKQSTFVVDLNRSRLIETFGRDADSYVLDLERPLNYFGAV